MSKTLQQNADRAADDQQRDGKSHQGASAAAQSLCALEGLRQTQILAPP